MICSVKQNFANQELIYCFLRSYRIRKRDIFLMKLIKVVTNGFKYFLK